MKDESVKDIYEEYKKEFKRKHPFKKPVSFKKFNDMVEDKVKTDVHRGIKCYQFQILCHHSSNGQSPFTSLVLNLREAENEQERKDLALLIENMLDRRIKGVTGSHGESVTPLFPKLLYWTCDGLNARPGDPYYYLTKKAAKCITIRMAPDINSEKMSREIKSGQIIPSMGCRSWLTPLWIEKTYPLETKFHWQEVDTSNIQYDGAPGKNFNYSRGFGEYSAIPENIAKGVVINFRGNSGWVKSIDKENNIITIIQPRVYGRWNNGVVTINIPQYAGEAREKVNKLLSKENEITSFIDLPEESIDEFDQD